jgi:HJR/Mrr/RecB family endonuclease
MTKKFKTPDKRLKLQLIGPLDNNAHSSYADYAKSLLLDVEKKNPANFDQSSSIAEFSAELKIPVESLISQFTNAGIPNLRPYHLVSETHKRSLLEYLRAENSTLHKTKATQIYQNDEAFSTKQILLEEVNDELLFHLTKDPSILYQLGSRKFEELIAKLFADRGHEVSLTPKTRDGGYDILARVKDAFSEFIILAECKKYSPDNKVGVEIVRGLYGVVEEHKANQGIIITSSFFTKEAQQTQLRMGNRMALKDYNDLVEWIKPYSKNV